MVTLAQPERNRFWQEIDNIRRPDPPIAMEARKQTGWAEAVMRVRAKFIRGEEPLRHATVSELVFELPMTQSQVADATGHTSVHVNRMLKALPAEGVEVRRGTASISDWNRLIETGDLDPGYLQMSARRAQRIAAN